MKREKFFAQYRDPRWQKKRLEVLERAGFKCEECGASDKELHVHHCYYFKGAPPWKESWGTDFQLKALCADCHISRQSIESELRDEFRLLLSRLNEDQLHAALSEILAAKAYEGPFGKGFSITVKDL